ncbi:NfeD family protein [Pasteurella sp. PK-2025]|uniref:NfeD family protein n=1 Tax=unclassified Pasteurella TaxID=2621516 RepID=UPI003C72E302
MEWFSTWGTWHWLILGFVLLIAELLIPGVFLLWWGLSAVVIAAVMALLPNVSLTVLAISYAILAILLSVVWWKYQHNKDQTDQLHSSLNQRDHAMLGTKGSVQEIAANGIGRGHFGDTTWRIQGANLQVGDLIEVYQVEGITLKVKKVD